MINLVGPLNTGAATGGAGAATANATSTAIVTGRLIAAHIKYNDSPPAGTTDVTIATAGTTCPVQTLLTISNSATDNWYYPTTSAVDAAGAGVTYDGTRTIRTPFAIADKVKVTIAQANDNDNADVYLLMEC